MLTSLPGKGCRVIARAVALAVCIPLLVCCDGGTNTPTGGGGPSAGAPIRFEYPYEGGVWNYVGGDANEYEIITWLADWEDPPILRPPRPHVYPIITWRTFWKEERKSGFLGVTYLRLDPDRYVSLSREEGIDETVNFLVFPLEVGNSWLIYTGSGPINHNEWTGVKATVVSKEKIAIRAGTFDCYKIEYTGNKYRPDFTIWWASGVGGWGVKSRGFWPVANEPVTMELERYRFDK